MSDHVAFEKSLPKKRMNEIAQIRLPVEELSEYRFVDPGEAPMLSTRRMGAWVRQSLEILPTQQTLDLE